ncbi:hypothetical protein MKW94_003888 [Papaver nudicaule]|nr:hypothetical protein [Papaver nudicaule]
MYPTGQTLDVIHRSRDVWRIGYVKYLDALKLQEKLVCDWKLGKITDTLLSLQHPPTYNIEKRQTNYNLLVPKDELHRMRAELHHTDRGGGVTFDIVPGQAILYPIISLQEIGLGARKYVVNLELTLIHLAHLYGMKADVGSKCETGVYVGEEISPGITSHVLAFNIDPDLNHLHHILPFKRAERGVTSVKREAELELPGEQVIHEQLVSSFVQCFGDTRLLFDWGREFRLIRVMPKFKAHHLTQCITCRALSARSNKTVTVAHDGISYVRNQEGPEWIPTSVILRLRCVNICIQWIAKENKITVGSRAKTVCMFYYD